jgi:spore coat protein U-like protein
VYSFSSDRGLNNVASQNFLSSGTATLAYSLMVNDGRSPFDPATNGQANAQTEIATGRTDSYALAINVPASQMVPAGAYSDTVTFNLNY